MTPKLFLALCLAAALFIDASGTVRAQAPAGNVTVVTIIDVLSERECSAERGKFERVTQQANDRHATSAGARVLQDFARCGSQQSLHILGVWKDMKSFEDYRGAESTRAFRQAFQSKLGGPFDERIYIDLK